MQTNDPLAYPRLLLLQRRSELERLDRTEPNYESCRRSLEQVIQELQTILCIAEQKMTTHKASKEPPNMAVKYEIEPANRLVRTTFTRIVTSWEHSLHLTNLRMDPKFDPNFSELLYFDDKVNMRLGFMDFRSEIDPFSRTSRRAIVASKSQPAVYGTARMFETGRGDPNIRVFPTIAEAESWLGVEPEDLALHKRR
jgi:hypothetical protein